MKNILIIIVHSLVLTSCNQSAITLKPNKKGACSKKTTQILNELISQDSTMSSDLEQILIPKSMDKDGRLRSIDFSEARNMVCNLKESSTLNYPLPVFEVKQKNQWIVFSNSEGMWGPVSALILVDLNNKTIVKLKCDHKNETPLDEINFMDTKYSKRFETLNLKELDNIKIDGVSGATKTHDAYVEVIRNAVDKYKF